MQYAAALPGEVRMLLLFMVSRTLLASTCLLPCLADSRLKHHGSSTLMRGYLHLAWLCVGLTYLRVGNKAGFHCGGDLSTHSD